MKRRAQIITIIIALVLACLAIVMLSGCERRTDNGLGTPFPTLEAEIWEALNE